MRVENVSENNQTHFNFENNIFLVGIKSQLTKIANFALNLKSCITDTASVAFQKKQTSYQHFKKTLVSKKLSVLTEKQIIRNELISVLSDKKIGRHLLNNRHKLSNLSRSSSVSEVLQALDEEDIKLCPINLQAGPVIELFEKGTLLVRTLVKGSPGKTSENTSYTPGKNERNTLNNRLGHINIQITPSTMIGQGLKVSTLSNHPDRPRWNSMPTIFYQTPMKQGEEMFGKVDRFKKIFGNALSFASNNGFTKDFVAKVASGHYSYSELIDDFKNQQAIIENLKTTDRFATFPTSLAEIKQQIADFQSFQKEKNNAGLQNVLYQDGSLPHNEVIVRVWLWDVSAVEIGKDLKEGLAATRELQIARKSLVMEFEEQGTAHPIFEEFVLQQLSIAESNSSLDISTTIKRYEALSESDRQETLLAIIEKLEEPISICRYLPGEAKIISITDEIDISSEDVFNALDAVLKARLGTETFELITSTIK